jgi:hypothetical protein
MPACAQRPLDTQKVSVADQPSAAKNPTFLFRSISVSEEWDQLTDSNTLTTTLGYVEPFRNASTALGFSVPFAKKTTSPTGPTDITLGDMTFKGQWIPFETQRNGVLTTATLTAPTGDNSVGSGRWSWTPSIAGAHFWGPRFLLAQFVQQQVSFAGRASRAHIKRTDLDLYGVYSSHSLRWWINGDLNLRIDESHRNQTSSTFTIGYGKGLHKIMGGTLNGAVQTGLGMGRGRPYNDMLLISISLVDFH